MASAPTMLLTAYQPLALTQLSRAGRYLPRAPKLWAVKGSCGIPISGPMLAVSASSPQPMRLPSTIVATPSAKPRPRVTARAPTNHTGRPMLAESQSVKSERTLPCRSVSCTCSVACGSMASTCSRYATPESDGFSLGFLVVIWLLCLLCKCVLPALRPVRRLSTEGPLNPRQGAKVALGAAARPALRRPRRDRARPVPGP